MITGDISVLILYIALVESDYFIGSNIGLIINVSVVLIIIQEFAKLLKNIYKLTVIPYFTQRFNKKHRT